MKTTVEIGKTYALRSEAGGEVTDVDGKALESLEPNKQVHMTAQESEWLVPDDCKVTKTNFKQAALALGLLGGGDKLPAGYTRLEYLESTGSQYIDTGYNDRCTASLRYELLKVLPSQSASTKWGQKNALSNSRGSRWYVRADNLNFNLYACFDVAPCVVGQIYNIVHKIGDGNNVLSLTVDDETRTAGVSGAYTPQPYRLFDSLGAHERLYWFKLSALEQLKRHYIPALDPNGTPCMFDLVSKQALRNVGTGQFIAGMTLAQAAQLGRKLPSTDGALTLSLPEGFEMNERVVESLTLAEAKGWVLTIQTYAAQTAAATFALRRVWVRRVQDEHGSYVAADGSRWLVEWCVDVIGADPEELGYERYRSVDAAVAYWELVPYVEPETEENAD